MFRPTYLECCSMTQHTQCTEVLRYYSPKLGFYTLLQNRCKFWILEPSTGCHELITCYIWYSVGLILFLKTPSWIVQVIVLFPVLYGLEFQSHKWRHPHHHILIGNDSCTTGSHDHCLLQILNKCREICFKLNPDKCIFNFMQVLFFKHLVTSEGLKPDP